VSESRFDPRDLAFFTVIIAFAMQVLDSTIVNIALPAIEAELGASPAQIQWVTASYFLALGIGLVLGGRLGDRYGYRITFIVGVAGFTVASMLCGVAPSPWALVLARTAQGLSAALMAPQVMSFMQVLYSPIERISRLALFGALGGIIGVGGPIIGGLLIEWNWLGLGWRLIFLLNLPIGIACIASSFIYLPAGGSPRRPKLDWVGFFLLAVCLFALLTPLIEGRENGWSASAIATILFALALSVASVIYLRRREKKVGSAAISIRLFADHCFSLGLLSAVIVAGALAGFLLTLSIVLQQGLGYSALKTSILHVPFALGISVSIAVIVRKYLAVYEKYVLLAGCLAGAVGVGGVIAAFSQASPSNIVLSVSLLLLGLGLGLLIGPLSSIVFARVDPGEAGSASAVFKTTQQIGGALGVAIVGGVFFATAGEGGAEGLVSGFIASGYLVLISFAVLCVLGASFPSRIFNADDGRHAAAEAAQNK